MMAYKILLLVVFLAAIASLASGLVFLVKDRNSSRMANALLIRVSLCGVLIILIVYGIYSGYIQPHNPIGLQR